MRCKFLLTFTTFLVLLINTLELYANRYIYIQGDKKVPFVVSVEGYSLPKLGQNYCIIPNLEAGVINVQITFQSKDIPVHKFKIQVPENSSRGLVLTPVNNKTYALFDMQTQAYIQNNNKQDEAFLAFNPESFNSVNSNTLKSKNNNPVATDNYSRSHISNRNNDNSVPRLVKPQKQEIETNKQNMFLDEIDLNKNQRYNKPQNANSSSILESTENTNSNINRNCENASTNEEFEDFSASYITQSDDTEKLKYIRKNKSKVCLNTSHILILSNFLQGQSSKFELFEMLKNDVIDKENYHQLQKVFNSDYMKDKFIKTIN